jgi:hypothetical protein
VIVYVAHAISAPLVEGGPTWARHRESVRALAEEVAHNGAAPIVPIMFRGLSHREALRLDHYLVDAADAIIVHDSRWTADSSGVMREIRWARESGKPVLHSIDDLLALTAERRTA